MSFAPVVVWHDIECGHYGADLALWDELAAREPGPVLDVGAGTGRVSLVLAALGHDVTALDREPDLLAALAARPSGERVTTVVADAQAFALDRTFGLILVPMQTIQLLPERAGFFAAARAHLAPGGLLAIAIAAALEDFGELDDLAPETAALGPWRFASQPVAVRALGGATRIERRRTTVAPGRRGDRGGRRDRARHRHRRGARGGGPRRRADAGARAGDPRDGGVRRRRGGDAAWLTARCASSRSIPT